MKIVFETEYEKLCFERLLESVYEDSDLSKTNASENLADSLASLFVRVAKADMAVERPGYAQSIGTGTSPALPALPLYRPGKDFSMYFG